MNTEKKFRLGDVRHDGLIFYQYCKKPNGGEGYYEKWLSPQSFANSMAAARKLRLKYAADPEYLKERNARAVAKHKKDYRARMLHTAKQVSRRKKIPCNLETVEDIPYAAHCPVFGWPLKVGVLHRAPSLDRIVPELGYVKGNVIVVSTLANTIKTNASPEQILAVGNFYKRLFKKLGLRP